MVYIQLSIPYRDYDKVKIQSVQFFDDIDKKRLYFIYQVYRNSAEKLFVKSISIDDQVLIAQIASVQSTSGYSAYDAICKELLNYMIINSIETGTLEYIA